MRIGTRRPVGPRSSTYARIDQLYGTILAVPSIYDACQPDRRVNNDRAALPPSARTRRDRLKRTSEPAYDRHWHPTHREYWVTDSTDLQHTLAYGRGRNTKIK